MTNKTIINTRPVGGDYFGLYYLRKSPYNLQYYLDQFNPDDYWIFKSTRKFKQVTYQDLLEFKYAQYILFKKDLYSLEDILKWIEFLDIIKGDFLFLHIPFPPIHIMDRIKVKL